MTKLFDYELPENHVDLRPGISDELRRLLFEIPRENWERHPAFRGEAEFWLDIHKGFLHASGTLSSWAEDLVGRDENEGRLDVARRISLLGSRVIHHAHGHHHIEDHHFFPIFLRAHPQLQYPLELLDGDHKVLGTVLDNLESAVRALASVETDGTRDSDQLLWDGEQVLKAAQRLDALFRRHINDEEEICVPVMLGG